ncbi:MAG: hypothetical protein QOK02_1051 [Mycobacterium sp.]|jgi:hypothetical protein|nr:hypothetical protein [Mycobacterium sp.]
MRAAQWLTVTMLILAACSSAPKTPAPPSNFPDLSAFTAVDPQDYHVSGTSFVSPNQIDCVLDFGPHAVTVCSGAIPGMPASTRGDCAWVHKADPSTTDAPYVLEHSDDGCASSRARPIESGKKLVAKNSTCAVGEGGLVACIDADNKHGFVLQPSGSWAF